MRQYLLHCSAGCLHATFRMAIWGEELKNSHERGNGVVKHRYLVEEVQGEDIVSHMLTLRLLH